MFAPDVVYSSRNRTPTPFPLLAGMNFCASAFKGAAILFVLYQSIACRARHRFCDRAEPDVGRRAWPSAAKSLWVLLEGQPPVFGEFPARSPEAAEFAGTQCCDSQPPLPDRSHQAGVRVVMRIRFG